MEETAVDGRSGKLGLLDSHERSVYFATLIELGVAAYLAMLADPHAAEAESGLAFMDSVPFLFHPEFDQFCQRIDCQLSHDASSMNLGRGFGNAKLVGDLLV